MSMCKGPAVTQNLGFPGIGSGSVWLQHGPRRALGSELGSALSSTVVKKPPVAESWGVVNGGQDVCTGGRAGCACSLVEQQVQVWHGQEG